LSSLTPGIQAQDAANACTMTKRTGEEKPSDVSIADMRKTLIRMQV